MAAYAILLRAVNVGGRSVPMATFRQVLEDLGYADVRTYLQSGQAVARTPASAKEVERAVQDSLKTATGMDIDVLVRSAQQLQKIIERAPFDDEPPATTKHVVFLKAAGDAKELKDFEGDRFAPEKLVVNGTEIYLSLPDGMGRSKLAAAVSTRQKKARATTRNWNTVTALRDLTAQLC